MTARQLKRRRKKINLSQAALAREMGVDIRTVRRWEAGDIPISKLAALALETVELHAQRKEAA